MVCLFLSGFVSFGVIKQCWAHIHLCFNLDFSLFVAVDGWLTDYFIDTLSKHQMQLAYYVNLTH